MSNPKAIESNPLLLLVKRYGLRNGPDSSSIISIIRAISGNVSLLLALVAGLVLVGIATDACDGIDDRRTRGSQAVPGHMVGSATTVTLDRWNGGSIESTSRRRSARGEGCSASGRVRARPGDMSEAAAIIALLSGPYSQAGTLGLNMANTAAGVALLGGNRARGWASGRLMPRLAAVVTETLLRGAVLRNVTEVAALEAPLPAELIGHDQTSLSLDTSLCQLTLS